MLGVLVLLAVWVLALVVVVTLCCAAAEGDRAMERTARYPSAQEPSDSRPTRINGRRNGGDGSRPLP